MGWLIALVLIALIGFIPIGIHGLYNENGAKLFLKIGHYRIGVYPRRSKKGRSSPKPKSNGAKSVAQNKNAGSAENFTPYAKQVVSLLVDLHKKLRVDLLELKVILAGGDPSDLAIYYGNACAAVSNLIPLLEKTCNIIKRDVEVECSFTNEKTIVFAQIVATMSFGRFLSIVAHHGFIIGRKYFYNINQRKGGTKV